MAEEDRIVREDQDDTWTILAVGDEVETPEGPGTVEAIEIALARYQDDVELEPPHIQVKLEDGSVIQTCACKIGLADPDDTEVLHQEFERLWPPQQDHVPEDAESMLPEESEEPEASVAKPRTLTIEGRLYREVGSV